MNSSISLTPELVGTIERWVGTGRYASAAELVRETLGLLAEKDGWQIEESDQLRRSWSEGVESGDAGLLDFEELKADARRGPAGLTEA